MIDYIEKAKAFAMMAHKGQTDKAGEDYFTAHVAVVADGVEPDPLVKAAAYLHDTVEDTGTTIDTIRAEFPQEVAEAVSVLTREKDMTYAEYIWRVKQNDIAVKVKCCLQYRKAAKENERSNHRYPANRCQYQGTAKSGRHQGKGCGGYARCLHTGGSQMAGRHCTSYHRQPCDSRRDARYENR